MDEIFFVGVHVRIDAKRPAGASNGTYSGFVLGCAGGAALVRHAPRLPPLLPAAAVQLTLGVLALRKAKKN